LPVGQLVGVPPCNRTRPAGAGQPGPPTCGPVNLSRRVQRSCRTIGTGKTPASKREEFRMRRQCPLCAAA
jgi:hypothetical protein